MFDLQSSNEKDQREINRQNFAALKAEFPNMSEEQILDLPPQPEGMPRLKYVEMVQEVPELFRKHLEDDDLSSISSEIVRKSVTYNYQRFRFKDNGNSISQNLNSYLIFAAEKGASDIFINTGEYVRAKINGKQYELSHGMVDDTQAQEIIKKLYDNSETGQAVLSKQEQIDKSYAVETAYKTYRFRVNISSSYAGQGKSITLRVVRDDPLPLDYRICEKQIDCFYYSDGLIIVAGATGTGKTNLLSGFAYHKLKNPLISQKLVFIESPIEISYKRTPRLQTSIVQFEIGRDVKSFEKAIEAAMRQAPNDIMVGEIRSPDIMNAALQASTSGHLTYGTLHASTVPLTFKRIAGWYEGVERQTILTDVISTARMFISQRLVQNIKEGGRIPIREYLIFNDDIRSILYQNLDNLVEVTEELLWKHGVPFPVYARQLFLEGLIKEQEIIKLSGGKKISNEKLDNRIRELKLEGHPAFQANDF